MTDEWRAYFAWYLGAYNRRWHAAMYNLGAGGGCQLGWYPPSDPNPMPVIRLSNRTVEQAL